MALAMTVTLALMVYSLGQRQLRLALQQAGATLPDQKGQQTARPTFECRIISLPAENTNQAKQR